MALLLMDRLKSLSQCVGNNKNLELLTQVGLDYLTLTYAILYLEVVKELD